MSIVNIEFDNTLEKSKIIMPLLSSSSQEGGDYYNNALTDKAQTAVFGIQVPLIMINNIIIDFDAIQYFSLKSQGRLPELVMTVEDKYQLITNLDKPTNDNEVRIQVIPRFDNAYKKVDLTFYINTINVVGSMLRLNCTYKVPSLFSSQFKTYGEIDTYSLFKTIATENSLGFATNIAKGTDIRYAYCDNKTPIELMESEIQFSNSTEHILDWWIDLWDNINLVDIKERYNSIDSNDDLQIWVAGQVNEVTVDKEITPIKVPAVINNYPGFSTSELYVKGYSINNKSGIQLSSGTDKVIGVYEELKDDYLDYLIQDGDVKNDIFTKYKYVGENYGEYNYMLANHLRNSFIQKMTSETIVVTLQSPLLGLMRGHKVNFIRYINNDMIENKLKNLEDAGLIDRNVQSNISLKEYEIENDGKNGKFVIDRTCSGQYLITGIDISYTNNKWNYNLTLTKPASSRVSLINN